VITEEAAGVVFEAKGELEVEGVDVEEAAAAD